jgi:hypothetical protein
METHTSASISRNPIYDYLGRFHNIYPGNLPVSLGIIFTGKTFWRFIGIRLTFTKRTQANQ